LRELGQAALPLYLRKGQMLFRRGDATSGLYVVLDGRLKMALPAPVASGDRAMERAIEMFGPGAVFGEDCLFADDPHLAECQALTACTVLHVAKPALCAAVEREPELAMRLMRNLSARLHGLMRDIESVSLQNALQRVASFLVEQAPAGRDTWLAGTQRVMASKLGMTPETLSRVMTRFAAEKLVRVERGRIELLDMERLGRQFVA
jgi:CRP-like cAMP-binding protein